MKKTIFMFAVALIGFSAVIAQAPDYSRWSFAIKGGINQYRIQRNALATLSRPGDNGTQYFIQRSSWQAPVLQVEYTATPYYGIGLEAGFYNYNRYQFEGYTIDAVLNSSFNVSNLVSPLRRGFWRKTALYANFGMGVGRFHYKDNDPRVEKEDNGFSPVVTAGLNFDYNFTPVLALILEGQYRAYTNDELGGKRGADGSQGAYDNDALVANIGLRFKFGAISKDHTRNALVKEYFSDLYNVVPPDDGLKQRVDNIEKAVKDLNDDVKALEPKVQKNTNDINDLKRALDNVKNSLADNHGCKHESVSFDDDIIHFRFNSSEIDGNNKLDKPSSFEILNSIAQILKESGSGARIKIIGHTDNIGSDSYNLALSKDRAIAVKNYLVNRGIDASMITTDGAGEKQPIASNNTPDGRAKNRRVEFQVSK
ncbi:MAG: OmpA family protein [Prevotellaceae bacterium]|jgi:outer membrane protein OmpA-like peptidoglycan-associated protein|nr:OmpA family protein [Prevotellaceae bacterium]